MTENGIREVTVIGSGPAQLKPLVFCGAIFVGGSLTTTTEGREHP